MSTVLPVITVTVGEPAGIGPELCARLAERDWPARIVFIGDLQLLRERAERSGSGARFEPYRGATAAVDGTVRRPGVAEVLDTPLAVAAIPGQLDARNSPAVVRTLELALAGCVAGEFAAMVTAPVQKSVINDAGVPFTGHTEFLAERTGTERVVMLLVGETAQGWLRVALLTTHLPLSAVAAAVDEPTLRATLLIVDGDLRRRFGIASPRIAVCGLNPHAGEGGYLGREEIEIIAPTLERLRDEGMTLLGPLPADTAFVPSQLERCDCVLALFHDQGLPVLKHASFGHGVNVTLGLPIVRTSVDHGTALDLAANRDKARSADPGSMFAALTLAIELAARG